MSVKAKYIKDLPLKNELDGSESLLVQDSNGTKQAPLEVIVDEIKQNSQEKIRKIESDLAQTNTQLSDVKTNKMDKGGEIVVSQINKNKGKLDQTYMSDEFLQQMAGTTPINAVPADQSITLEKLAFSPMLGEKVNFANPTHFKKDYHIQGNGDIYDVDEHYKNTRFVTEFIPVTAGVKYYVNYAYQVATYDNDFSYVKYFVNQIDNIESDVRFTPTTDGYVRVCSPMQHIENLMVSVCVDDHNPNPFYAYGECLLNPSAIKNKSIDINKIDGNVYVGEKSYNILDLSATFFNNYIEGSDGLMYTCTGTYVDKIFATDFIEVEENTTYNYQVRAWNIVYYDEHKTRIDVRGGTNYAIAVTPKGCAYIRLSLWVDDNQDEYYIHRGEKKKPFIPYSAVMLPDNSVGSANIQHGSVGVEHLDESVYLFEPSYTSPNLFNRETAQRGLFVMGWSNGAVLEPSDGTDGYNASDYITVEPGVKYTFTTVYNAWSAVYDENKKYICGFDDVDGSGTTKTMPENAKYVRITVKDPEFDTFMMVKGEVLPSEYVPFGVRLIGAEQIDPNVLSGSQELRHCLPEVIHAVEGEVTEIFFDSILGVHSIEPYNIMLQGFKCIKESNHRKMVITNPTVNDSSTGNILVYNNQNKLIKTIPVRIQVHPVTNPSTPKNLLIIGDSLTGQNSTTVTEVYNKITQYNLTNLKLIGTLNWGEGKNHEGRGGWRIADYMTNKNGNPFWSNTLGKSSFREYCNKNGYSGIDYCIIHMNWNDQIKNPTHMYNQYKSIMQRISEDYPNCKIIAVSLSSYSSKYVSQLSRWCECDKFVAFDLADIYSELHNENENWHSINMLSQFDVEYANVYTTSPVNIRSSEVEKKLKDHVHCDTVGYLQIADAYFRYLMYLLDN